MNHISSFGRATILLVDTERASTTWYADYASIARAGGNLANIAIPQLDQHYEEHKKISGGQGIRGDLHSFFITKEDTAVFTGYQIVRADLTSMGKDRDSWIWESLFQELDIETGEVLFEWRASHHFPFEDSYVNPNAATHLNPWDWFHINTVDKDEKGNYLVSSRYGRCVIYIDSKTGDIIWQLGGKGNSFKDISDKKGDATTFLGQHDGRFDFNWKKHGKVGISMFDNRADWFNRIEDESVGHRIEIDTTEMTAKLTQSFRHPAHILSTSQGNMQSLPNGNVLVGYGYNGVFAEYAANGTILCDATMLPASNFGSGDVQSYRVLKFNWTGVPLTNPSLHFEDKRLYISWLGSTKVRRWTLQDSDEADGLFESVQVIQKEGFETEFVLEDGRRMRRYVRVLAVDGGGTQLSVSNPVDLLDPTEIWGEIRPGEEEHYIVDPEEEIEETVEANHSTFSDLDDVDNVADTQVLLVLGLLAAVSAALVAWMTVYGGCLSSWRRSTSEKAYIKSSRFRDDGWWRRFWHRIQTSMPGGKKSWQYGKLPLPRDEREANRSFAHRSTHEAFGVEEE